MLKEKFPFNNISKETVDKEGNVDEKSSEENVPIKGEKQNSSKVPMVNLDWYVSSPFLNFSYNQLLFLVIQWSRLKVNV